MSKRDFWIGVGCVAIGGALLASIQDRPGLMTSDVLGSSSFPRATLGVMSLTGVLLALANVRSLFSPSPPLETPGPATATDWRRIVAVAGIIFLVAAYVAFLPMAGFLLATPIFLLAGQVFIARITRQTLRPLTIASVMVGATVIIYLVFTKVLGQWLPQGSWF